MRDGKAAFAAVAPAALALDGGAFAIAAYGLTGSSRIRVAARAAGDWGKNEDSGGEKDGGTLHARLL